MSVKKERSSNEINPWPWIALLALFVLAVLGNYFLKFHGPLDDKAETWGQFGDYVGGILNPLLSFCAFIGLMLTLKSQHADSVKAEQRHQSQVFDNKVFQMNALLNDAASSLSFVTDHDYRSSTSSRYSGRDVVDRVWVDLQVSLQNVANSRVDENFFVNVCVAVAGWKNQNWKYVGGYIEILIFLLEFSTSDDASAGQSEFAVRLVKAQLSDRGRVLLFYILVGLVYDYELVSKLQKRGFFLGSYIDPLYVRQKLLLQKAKQNYAQLTQEDLDVENQL